MVEKKLRYPTGVRPLLLEEAARRKRIESRFVSILEDAGFAEIVLPIIDYVDPYASILSRDSSRSSYRFVDREGELVAIRSDFTPMVARALAPTLDESELPLKIFYRGDVIRCDASRLGVNRELFQIGAEIVGEPSLDADIEVMNLAVRIAREFGIEPRVVYNDTSIAALLSEDERKAVVTKRALTPADIARRLTPATAARLESIAAALDPAVFALHLDDLDEETGYYTGIRFRLFGPDSRKAIAQGGRYDDVYQRFGTPAAAAGFTFTIDDLD